MQRAGNFVINTGRAPEPVVQPILSWLRQAGDGVQVGQTVQLGATILQAAQAPTGEKTLLAPRKGSMPIEWQDDIGGALVAMAQQRYTTDT